jgi:anti-anti-sigma regulatory factor
MGKPVKVVKVVKRKGLTEVAIVGPMTIGTAREIRDGLLKAFSFGKDVEISLAGSSEIDVAGLQLLCSAHRSSVNMQLGFRVTGTGSEELFSVAQLAGMMRQTGCVHNVGSCIWHEEEPALHPSDPEKAVSVAGKVGR